MNHARALVIAMAMVCVGRAGATPLEPGGSPSFGFARAEHGSYASTDVRPGVAPQLERGARAVAAAGGAGALVIDVTFDGTITNDPNAALIEAMINEAVTVHESVLDDPIVVSIRFRYSTLYANGTTPLPTNLLAASETGILVHVPWDTYITALTADAKSADDATANASLPPEALSTFMNPSTADGRAIGLNTPPAMFVDGSVGPGGQYDGIITINSDVPFTFTRSPVSGTYDAQRSVEHEIDEVLGLGSNITSHPDLRPQDLFSWSAAGVRSLSSSGSRYFSIDGGTTSIVGFNQEADGDFGDWLSGPCPQTHPYVQNAFSCPDQTSDVTQTSPEGINLDVIGYDLVTVTTTTIPTTSTTAITPPSTTTTTTPTCQPGQIPCCPVGQPGCGLCGTDCGNGHCCLAPAPLCDNANGLCVASCAPPQTQCCPVGHPGCGLCGTDCNNGSCCPASAPFCDNANGQCLVQEPTGKDCSSDQTPCSDAALGFPDVTCCSQASKGRQCAAACSPIVNECKASCATASRPKKCRKRCQSAIVGHCKKTRPHACS